METKLHTIAELKNSRIGRQALIVGTGPSADEYVTVDKERYVTFAINRAVCLGKFDFLCVDCMEALQEVGDFAANARHIIMPIWSRDKVNVWDKGNVYYCVWAYEADGVLTAKDYSLNDIILYISWGTVQPTLHLAHKMGMREAHFLGCDGGMKGGKMYADKITKYFSLPVSMKKNNQYKDAHGKLAEIAKILGVKTYGI